MVYKLDVSKEEYRDDYANHANDGELWQVYAKDQLVENLHTILADAESYKSLRKHENNKTWLSHNAVLVTSPRGSGKTVFLRNSEKMWKNSEQGKAKLDSLFFLDVIDPTMLMDNDSFANVIIAQIYQAVSDTFNCHANISSKKRDAFHHSLKKLADSMGKTSEFNGSIGIDKILKYSSGIQVENNFHHFVESAIEVLGCSAIVVLIDDVDMALDNAFEVVDEVRRYLGCPYIIPIVSGGLKLYEHMTQTHFDESSYDNHCLDKKLLENGIQLTSDLTAAYLTKVFPSHTRISLFSIENLLSKMMINEAGNTEISYSDYRERLFNKFNYLRHNRDSRKGLFKPKSARGLTQLVRTIKPSELSFEEDNVLDLHIKYRGWAAQQKEGGAFANAESVISFSHDEEQGFDIQRLLTFNIKAQSDQVIYPWAKYDVYASQFDALNTLPLRGGKDVKNKQLLDTIFDGKSKILKPMPPLEFLVSDLFIGKKVTVQSANNLVLISSELFPKDVYSRDLYNVVTEGEESEASVSKVEVKYSVESALLDIYTEGELYSTLNNTKRFVVFSRAFEILFYSFISSKADLSFYVIDEIVKKKPFYSIVSFAETKISIDGENEEIIDELDKGVSSLALFGEIIRWKQDNESSLGWLDSFKMIPIFSYVFNSVFTAMNVIKANYASSKNNFKDEHLSDMVLRFKYNVLNAILRSGIYGEAVYANVLIGAKSETVRDAGEVVSRDKTYTRNKARLESEIERFSKAGDEAKLQRLKEVIMLHDAIDEHPIFSILNSDCGLYAPTLKLGGISSSKDDKKVIQEDEENQAFRTLVGQSIDSANFILDTIINNQRVKRLSAFEEKLRIASEISDVEIAISLIKEALPKDFEQQESYKILSERLQNFIKAIWKHGKQDAED
ncbi:TPA: hypothetical protein PEO44_003144 [Vibrio parahaemolyticus]|nr:hypothetical protein [Vibrio parahaemolyticus]